MDKCTALTNPIMPDDWMRFCLALDDFEESGAESNSEFMRLDHGDAIVTLNKSGHLTRNQMWGQ